MNTSGISPSFLGLSRSSGQVTHVLLTRSRLCPRASPGSSLHLHVLSTPPAFVLSQDQTLRKRLACHPAGRSRRVSLSDLRVVNPLWGLVVHREAPDRQGTSQRDGRNPPRTSGLDRLTPAETGSRRVEPGRDHRSEDR